MQRIEFRFITQHKAHFAWASRPNVLNDFSENGDLGCINQNLVECDENKAALAAI